MSADPEDERTPAESNLQQRIDAALRRRFAAPPTAELARLVPGRARPQRFESLAWFAAAAASIAVATALARWPVPVRRAAPSIDLASRMREPLEGLTFDACTSDSFGDSSRWVLAQLERQRVACTTVWSVAGAAPAAPTVLGELSVAGTPFDACVAVATPDGTALIWIVDAARDPGLATPLLVACGETVGRGVLDGRVLYVCAKSTRTDLLSLLGAAREAR